MYPSTLPKPPAHLEKELRAAAFGAKLKIVASDYLISAATKVIFRDSKGDGIHRPRYYVFLENDDGSVELLFRHETPDGEFLPCDRRIVDRIGTDLAKLSDNPAEIERILIENEEKIKAAAEKKRRERQKAFLEENASAIRKVVDSDGQMNTTPAMTTPVLYSWTGQPIRSSQPVRLATDEEVAAMFVQPE